MHRRADGNDDLVHAGDAVLGIDEEPFPIERDDLHLERSLPRLDRLEGIEIVRADPDHAAEKQDHQERNRPYDQLDAAGIDPVRPVAGARVGGAEPPREDERRDDRGHHDHQHDFERVEQNFRVGVGDRAAGVEHAAGTAGEERQRHQARDNPQTRTFDRRSAAGTQASDGISRSGSLSMSL